MEHQATLDDDSLFLRLYNFDFKNSPQFVEGWRKIRQITQDETLSESYIKAQVFFYSRHVETVDLYGYCQWLKSTNREVHVLELESENQEQDSTNQASSMSVSSDKASSEDNVTDKHPVNFSELIQMVQQGVKVPGVEDLNIEPTNENPSPAKLDRPKKPWET